MFGDLDWVCQHKLSVNVDYESLQYTLSVYSYIYLIPFLHYVATCELYLFVKMSPAVLKHARCVGYAHLRCKQVPESENIRSCVSNNNRRR